MTRERLAAAVLTAATVKGRAPQHGRLRGIEDYLRIHGPYLPNREAARRLGVTTRTITRWRAALRSAE